MRIHHPMILAALLGLAGCTAGGAPESECAGGKCDEPNADETEDEGEPRYETGFYDLQFEDEFSVACEGGDVDPANLGPGLEPLMTESPFLAAGPVHFEHRSGEVWVDGAPCDTDGSSFRCVVYHEIQEEADAGFTVDLRGALIGEWSAPDAMSGRAGAEVSCTGAPCDLLAEQAGLIGPEGEPRSFPCFLGWRYDAEHIGDELPEAD